MKKARYRALTPESEGIVRNLYSGRNEESSIQGIDTRISFSFPSFLFPRRNEESSIQGIDTVPCNYKLSCTSDVEMKKARYRALTHPYRHPLWYFRDGL